jgi:hypothetical protein
LIVVVATLTAWGFWDQGEHAARQCAVDYPHDGQCGLEAMKGDVLAAFFGGGVLVVGLTVVSVRYFRSQSERKS